MVGEERDRDRDRDGVLDRGERDFERDDLDGERERDRDGERERECDLDRDRGDRERDRDFECDFLLSLSVLLLPLLSPPAVTGRALEMKPPHALWDPLFRSTVTTAGGVFVSDRSFFLRSWYFFLRLSTASSNVSAFGLDLLYKAIILKQTSSISSSLTRNIRNHEGLLGRGMFNFRAVR